MSEIIINNKKYELSYEEDGKPKLRRYNEKYKIWVDLVFSKEKTGAPEYIIGELSKLYIERMTASL